MCGICGVMSLRPPGPDEPGITETAIIRMRDAMQHRGPDDEGVFVDAGIGLGHRRLSIIDLSGGHQPMANPEETVWITYNGEIYNFHELRDELEARGLDFRTKSDTEVIVRGYEAYGDAVVERLRGMFAFAIWDGPRRRLLLARDPLGIKPLYYTQTPDGLFLFASEIRALLTWPGVRAEVDGDALWDYLGQRYVPGPRTMFKGIAKLPAGHLAIVSAGDVAIRRYWDVPLDGETWSEAECVATFRDLVTDSVRRELVSDVPLGVFLSGGLDSTTVTGLMAAMVSDPVRTFCVGYGAEQGVNERPFARLAAEHFGTLHREVEVGLEEFWRLLPQAVAAMEEPVAEAPSVSLLQLSRFTREHVTVVLSGEGADENLAGYGVYRHVLRARPLRWLGRAGSLADLYGSHRAARALERIRQGIAEYRGVSAIFTRDERARLLERGEPAVDSGAVHYERSRRLPPLQRMLYYDQKVWLPDDLLVKADKMTMAASLELRVPFLDHTVVEWAWRVPSSLKIHGGVGKVLLRRAFADLVPAPILNRNKEGFTVGGGVRFADNVGREARRLLVDERALDGLMDDREVARLVRRHSERVENLMEQLMVLIVLAWWRREPHGAADGADRAGVVAPALSLVTREAAERMASIEPLNRMAVMVETALISLPRMLDRTGVFVFTMRPSGPDGQSLRYTCITLIGLAAAVRAGLSPPVDVDRLVRGLAERRQQITNLGELGLLLWCLTANDEPPSPVYDEILDRIPASPGRLGALTSTELGWLLSGLARVAQLAPARRDIRDKARAAYAALRANYTEATGLFCYGGRAGDGLRRRLRRRFGFFDNQVYGIHAGVDYARVFADPDALAMAERCLHRVVQAQGPLGQWAWHYDVRTGAVVDRYPVYAVHQHGMGPMALHAVSEATGCRFDDVFERSLAWVFGENELGRAMLDAERGVIWRSIRRRIAHGRLVHVFKLLSLVGLQRAGDRLAAALNVPGQLDVDLECRPYELGWLLLALTPR